MGNESEASPEFHEVLLLPVAAGKKDAVSKLAHSESIRSRIGSIEGMLKLVIFCAKDADVAIFHARFASESASKAASGELQGIMGLLNDLATGAPTIYKGRALWNCTGASTP